MCLPAWNKWPSYHLGDMIESAKICNCWQGPLIEANCKLMMNKCVSEKAHGHFPLRNFRPIWGLRAIQLSRLATFKATMRRISKHQASIFRCCSVDQRHRDCNHPGLAEGSWFGFMLGKVFQSVDQTFCCRASAVLRDSNLKVSPGWGNLWLGLSLTKPSRGTQYVYRYRYTYEEQKKWPGSVGVILWKLKIKFRHHFKVGIAKEVSLYSVVEANCHHVFFPFFSESYSQWTQISFQKFLNCWWATTMPFGG